MEYHREEENEEETAADRIGAVALGESSDKTETQDTNVNQPLEVWPKQERKGRWVAGRIKTIGEYATFLQHFCSATLDYIIATAISETKVLPASVLLLAMAYCAIATYFYFN